MPNVLVVDDDPLTLRVLRGAFGPRSAGWKATFVTAPAAAIDALERGHFDALLVDLDLLASRGHKLQKAAITRDPAMVRLVMASRLHPSTLGTVAAFAHQVVAKPYNLEGLRGAVLRVHSLRGRMHDPHLREILGRVDALPAHPRLFFRLSRAMANPLTGAVDVAVIIEQDTAISAKVLQLVNSSYFSPRRTIPR